MLDRIADDRVRPQIPTRVVTRAIFIGLFCRLGSLHATAGTRASRFWKKHLGGHEVPSDDTLGRIAAQMDPDAPREVIHTVYATLKRNKALPPLVPGCAVALVDGHESTASYRRCCPGCLTRTIETRNGPRTQYYHRYAALHLVSEDLDLLLDIEPQLPGEDEVAASTRLIDRGCRDYPRAFDLVVADGLYAGAPFFRSVRSHGKHVMAVLKDERRLLIQDVRGLCELQDPVHQTLSNGDRWTWDFQDLTSWQEYEHPVRVVRCVDTTRCRRQLTGELEENTTEWFWVTTMDSDPLPTGAAVKVGRSRWRIENQGFNTAVNEWHLDHVYRHEPTAMLVLMLLTFLAINLFRAFYHRNLKPALRRRYTIRAFCDQIKTELLQGIDDWARPP